MIATLWIEHRIILTVDVIGLWVGPGVLHWDPRYYRWGVRLLVLGTVLSVVALLLLGLQPALMPLRPFGRPAGSVTRVPIIGAALMLLGVSVWQYVVLRRSDIRPVFEAREAQVASGAPYV